MLQFIRRGISKTIGRFALGLCLCIGMILPSAYSSMRPAQAGNRYISIGTGGPTGVYFLVGNAICRMVNKLAATGTSQDKLRCAAPSTGGSVYNLNTITAGDLNFGVVQSDWQYHAFHGSSKFAGKKMAKLRSVFSLHPEPFQIIVGKYSEIKSWADLKGKKVNIGNPGSGQRGTFEALLSAHKTDKSYFAQAFELTSSEQAGALCNENIDALGYSSGFPNSGVSQAIDGCGARILSLQSDTVLSLVRAKPFYSMVTIPKGTYANLKEDVKTFGVRATLVTSATMAEDEVYRLVKAVFDNIDQFKRLHPAFRSLTPRQMVGEGLSAPLHPGAIKYYKERGWL